MKNIKLSELQDIIETFLMKNIDNIREEYREECIKDIFSALGSKSLNTTKMQLLYATKMYDDYDNPYKEFAEFIEEKFGLDKNILEVGGGIYPALSEEIAKRQIKLNKGTITVYDPKILVNNVSHVKLIRESFNEDTLIKKYNLIVGLRPCGATETIIKQASKENIDYMIYPCNCLIEKGKTWEDIIYEICFKYIKENQELHMEKHYFKNMNATNYVYYSKNG